MLHKEQKWKLKHLRKHVRLLDYLRNTKIEINRGYLKIIKISAIAKPKFIIIGVIIDPVVLNNPIDIIPKPKLLRLILS